MTSKLAADSLEYCNDIITDRDPPEVKTLVNELIFEIKSGSANKARYWVHWCYMYNARCKKRKKKLECDVRLDDSLTPSVRTSVAIPLWMALIKCAKTEQHKTSIKAWKNLFMSRFSGTITRQKLLITLAALEHVPLVKNANNIHCYKKMMIPIYKQIIKRSGLILVDNHSHNDEKPNNNNNQVSQQSSFINLLTHPDLYNK